MPIENPRENPLVQLQAQHLKETHDDTRKVLDFLRKTRKTRGGTGAPLAVPAHLADAAAGTGIVITDAMLGEGITKRPAVGDDE